MQCLRREEVLTIEVLSAKLVLSRAIARQLGVAEGAVRYHLRRQAAHAVDGRTGKGLEAAQLKHGAGAGRHACTVRELTEVMGGGE
jgi:IS30 family transposase